MNEKTHTPLPRETVRQKFQRIVRRKFWRMNIHPSTWIAPTASIDRTWPKGVHIGANCLIEDYAIILAHDTTRGLYLDTRIGDDCIIGTRAIIMPGVVVGNGCRVNPGSVVTKDLPDNSIVRGNPATVFGYSPISEI